MKGSKRVYQCEHCGASQPKWAGQCPDCGSWNTLIETVTAAAPAPRQGSYAGEPPQIVELGAIKAVESPRLSSGLSEFDRVLGGGLVEGSVVLIGGDPGIGKSTLLLQSMALCAANGGIAALYVSGEESAAQIALRAERLKLPTTKLRLLTETEVERVLAMASVERPRILVIDSIQTLYSNALHSAPGSIAQVRECAAQLVRFAKASRTAVYLVGHVTKDGALAGPRVLEHMVDTVLYFEGELGGRYRLIRAFKNRFGAVNELGVFAMTDTGLKEVSNPSAILLSRHDEPVAGSVVMVTREGTRPLLVEVQALVDQSALGNPRRVTVGIENNRLSMLLAVLHRHGGIATAGCDVFANIVGGVRVTETGGDLAVVMAVVSSLRDRPLKSDLVMFGEIGLAGEIRPVQGGLERLREAAKHGFKRAIVPKANVSKTSPEGIQVIGVSRLAEALAEI
ncbi:MAG: DNA repair protein RadA [Gammaproteobacteria bacterium]|nr:DNA repair protein RadA [Gammaproteobacteria bacterium]